MGEYADYYIDSMIGGWHNDRPRRARDLPKPTCRRCGKHNLIWRQIKGGAWRLFEKSGTVLHDCRAKPSDSSAFEAL